MIPASIPDLVESEPAGRRAKNEASLRPFGEEGGCAPERGGHHGALRMVCAQMRIESPSPHSSSPSSLAWRSFDTFDIPFSCCSRFLWPHLEPPSVFPLAQAVMPRWRFLFQERPRSGSFERREAVRVREDFAMVLDRT